MHATHAEILGVHAATRGALVEDHQLLALLKAPQRGRQRADVHRLRRDIEEVREQPPDLAIEHADELAPLRHLKLQQLFRSKAESMFLIHGRDVVEPVDIADRLQVGLVLDELLGTAMEQPDVRVDALHDLTVEFEHETQHAVGGGMHRPEVDIELPDVGLGHQRVPSSGAIGETRAFFAFSLTRETNLDQGKIIRS